MRAFFGSSHSDPPTGLLTSVIFRHSSRSKRLRSLVAESSKLLDACFFFLENDGNGSELGSGDIEKADPAYMSVAGALKSTILTSLGTTVGPGPNLSNRPSLAAFFNRLSGCPRLKIVTFSAFKSSELDRPDLLETAAAGSGLLCSALTAGFLDLTLLAT